MEKIQSGVVIQRSKYHTEAINSCYDEFLRLRPDASVIGNIFYTLLQDATASYIKSIAKIGDNSILEDNSEPIVKLTEKYARIYFAMNKEERVLLMFRSALYDIVRSYDVTNKKYDVLASTIYENIRKLIVV